MNYFTLITIISFISSHTGHDEKGTNSTEGKYAVANDHTDKEGKDKDGRYPTDKEGKDKDLKEKDTKNKIAKENKAPNASAPKEVKDGSGAQSNIFGIFTLIPIMASYYYSL